MQTKIKVDNLKCHGCANTINSSLKKLDGVTMVDVNVENSIIIVEYDSSIKEAQITSRLADIGYPKQGTTTTIQKAKSYVSCAIGRF